MHLLIPFLLFVLAQNVSQVEPLLDLTKPLPTTGAGGGSGCASGNSGADGQAVPLKVTLFTSPPSLAVGTAIPFDVVLENTGRVAVLLPWSGAPPTLAADKLLAASVQLLARDSEGHELRLGGQLINAPRGDSAKALELRPGARARIRLAAPFFSGANPAGLLDRMAGRNLRLEAEVRLQVAPCRWGDAIRSVNSIETRLGGR